MGPCSAESVENYINSYEYLMPIMKDREWLFKASFDKANRTSIKGGRGPGLENSLKMFKSLKEKYPNVKLTTDVHEPWQVEKLSEVIDVIQIPAFLCRQTDLIVECARHFKKVNIKKGQWLGPNNLVLSVDKVRETNPDAEVWLTERGIAFGYHRLLVDFDIVDRIKKHYDKYILDCTHSTQRSRDVYGVQGRREVAERYMLSAPIFHYDGVFVETHLKPETAVSDGDCQIKMDRISSLLRRFDEIESSLSGWKDENLC
jgi:2-dehydro-3-deoxyphosphooctonate aldolase (KDO 8-P synthase)